MHADGCAKSSASKALAEPFTQGELAIAQYLDVPVQLLFPTRWTVDKSALDHGMPLNIPRLRSYCHENQFAISEITKLSIEGLPKSRRAIEMYVARNGWQYVEVPSSGRGGVRREYVLPEALFEDVKLQALATLAHDADISDVAQTSSTELATTNNNVVASAAVLADWQRIVLLPVSLWCAMY